MRYSRFIGERAMKDASRKYEAADSDKEPLNFVILSVRNEPGRIWNTRELHDPYLSKMGVPIPM